MAATIITRMELEELKSNSFYNPEIKFNMNLEVFPFQEVRLTWIFLYLNLIGHKGKNIEGNFILALKVGKRKPGARYNKVRDKRLKVPELQDICELQNPFHCLCSIE